MTKKPQLLVHEEADNVGVVVIEELQSNTEILCVITASNSEFNLISLNDVPIGHKIALNDFNEGDTVIKYGQDIGKIIQKVKKGGHVHVHNMKTKRW